MATTITQALLARFAASSVTDFSTSGGMWLDEVPATTEPVLPILGFTHSGETCQYTSEADYTEEGAFDFVVYAITVEEAERLALAVKAVFDPCIITPELLRITSAKVVEFKRESGQVSTEGFVQPLGKQVGKVNFSYRYIVKRTLPEQ